MTWQKSGAAASWSDVHGGQRAQHEPTMFTAVPACLCVFQFMVVVAMNV
jgi:hypothetical protein